MREYSYINKWETLLTPDIVSMISAIQELKGEQNLYVKTEEEEDQIINVQNMVGEKLKVSDCWNIKKAG